MAGGAEHRRITLGAAAVGMAGFVFRSIVCLDLRDDAVEESFPSPMDEHFSEETFCNL